MIDTLKMFGISVLVVIVGLLLTGNIGSTPGVGGEYSNTLKNFAQGITVKGTTNLSNGTASTSVNFGKTCWTVLTSTGSTTYVSFVGNGSNVRIATSTTSCL